MRPGDIVAGRYRVEEYIARGAMGAVYRAVDLKDGRRVALKVLHGQTAMDPVAVERFQQETELAQAVDHPGICKVLASGSMENGPLFMVMELVEGESLADWIKRNPGNWQNGVWVMLSLLEPLAVAHRVGIVHRDLKPENVMLTWDLEGQGSVKLLDFGIARRLSKNQGVTHTGTALGTPHYMAPEQFKDAKSAGAPADVWSLGVIMYEMITGATPFTGDFGPLLLVQVCSDPHPPIHERAPYLDARVARLVDRCLSKEPVHRPRDAGELWGELATIAGLRVPPKSSAVHAHLQQPGGDATVALEMTAILRLASAHPQAPAAGAPGLPPPGSEAWSAEPSEPGVQGGQFQVAATEPVAFTPSSARIGPPSAYPATAVNSAVHSASPHHPPAGASVLSSSVRTWPSPTHGEFSERADASSSTWVWWGIGCGVIALGLLTVALVILLGGKP